METPVVKERLAVPDSFHLGAIATDMDGTFFSSHLSILPTTLNAYRRAKAMGLTIIPATGRAKEGVELALKAAGADDVSLYPGVYLNGSTVYGPDGQILIGSIMPESVILKLVEFERKVNERVMSRPDWQEDPSIKNAEPEHGFLPVLDRSLKPAFITLGAYSCNGLVYVENNQLIDGMNQFMEKTIPPVGDLVSYSRQYPVYKMLLLAHSGALMKPLIQELQELIGSETEISFGVPRILEIAPKGSNKSEGLLRISQQLGIPLQSFAALGDGDNDFEMLKVCGFSIAMGNARPELKRIATTTTKSNTEDGWAVAVNSLLDHKEKKEHNKDLRTMEWSNAEQQEAETSKVEVLCPN